MLDPSPDEIRRWGNAAVDAVADYLGAIRNQSVYPDTSAREIRTRAEDSLPLEGVEFEKLLQSFRDLIVPFSRHNGHPRMFGYVQSPGTAVAAFADLRFYAECEPDGMALRSRCRRA